MASFPLADSVAAGDHLVAVCELDQDAIEFAACQNAAGLAIPFW
jgi:hypothetical protein